MTASLQEEYAQEMLGAFQQFGAYANQGRALPNVLDGLKPIHRRIAWAMSQMGATPRKQRVKSARAVGEVTGKFHPHGTSAAYEAMVGMAQPWNRLVPLVDGQGNWGSLSFGAAAERYTECRLTSAASALLGYLPSLNTVSEIEEDTVDMELNYSGEFLQPVVLPALWPHFLVNGTEGIGVGVSTKGPSHNLREVMNLAIHMVDSPNPRTSTVLEKIPGPDLPCDCDVYDTDYGGIESYITTGSGGFVMAARYTTETYKLGKNQNGTKIVFYGLPYRVAPEDVVDGIGRLVASEMLQPRITVVNATSSDGIRVVVDVKDLNVDDVIQRLYYHSRSTRLQETYSVSMNAAVDGEIQTVSVPEAIRHWLRHRRIVVRRRSQYRLDEAQARLHVVDGFLRAIPIAHEIVDLVSHSRDRKEASREMQNRWSFSDIQAVAILDMTIGQITRLGVEKYEAERSKLNEIIDKCNLLLTDHDALNSELKKEMRAVIKDFAAPRRAELKEGSATIARPDAPAVEAPVVNGFLARTGEGQIRWVQRDTINRQIDSDYVVALDPVTNMNRVECITNQGSHIRISMESVQKKWVRSKAFFGQYLWPGEDIVMVGSGAPFGEGTSIVIVTNYGNIKRLPWDSWAAHRENKSYTIINLAEGEEISKSFFLKPGMDIGIGTAYGRLLRMDADSVPTKGDRTKPVSGIHLEYDEHTPDSVVWAGPISEQDWIAYWTVESQVGWFSTSEIERAGRGTKGKTFTRTDYLTRGMAVANGETLNWYHASMNEPMNVNLEGQSTGTKLSDRQMLARAQGICTATSIWVS